jgi:hypothetical protein
MNPANARSANAAIHTISTLIACLSLALLGLVAHSVALKSRLEYALPSGLQSVGLSFLFWPACGGLVDCGLFTFLWKRTPFRADRVSLLFRCGRSAVESCWFQRS